MPLSKDKGTDAIVSQTVRARVKNPATAVDSAEFLVHYLVRTSIHQYKQRESRPPKLLHLPKAIEAAIQIDLGRSEGKHVRLRREGIAAELFGCPVIWDADEFKIV